jgi:hypothetical protein
MTHDPPNRASRSVLVVTLCALATAAGYVALAAGPPLASNVPRFLAIHAALGLLMVVAWRAAAAGAPRVLTIALAAAVAFRLIAATAPTSLSDDVFRYVWDGRIQAQGHHPYKFAPDDPMRAELRDDVWEKINHKDIPTIYPPLAELTFAALAVMKLGVTGFKLVFAILDLGVVFLLLRLLDAMGLPRHRALLYAWNPLAIVEVAASGHVEPLGLVLLVGAVLFLVEGKMTRAAAALAAAVQAKLLPLILVPGFARRLKSRALLVGALVITVTTAPYALRGPWFGGGVLAYAHRWEHGAVLFALVRRGYEWINLAPALKSGLTWGQARWGGADTALWDGLYAMVWPQELARMTVALLALGWAVVQSFRRQLDEVTEARLVLGGAILLAPTLYPWYVLWVLPFAAATAAGGWLLLGALVPLQYLAGATEVPWPLRLAILGPPVVWMVRDALVRSRR